MYSIQMYMLYNLLYIKLLCYFTVIMIMFYFPTFGIGDVFKMYVYYLYYEDVKVCPVYVSYGS